MYTGYSNISEGKWCAFVERSLHRISKMHQFNQLLQATENNYLRFNRMVENL